jgi:hypothetical protein
MLEARHLKWAGLLKIKNSPLSTSGEFFEIY